MSLLISSHLVDPPLSQLRIAFEQYTREGLQASDQLVRLKKEFDLDIGYCQSPILCNVQLELTVMKCEQKNDVISAP